MDDALRKAQVQPLAAPPVITPRPHVRRRVLRLPFLSFLLFGPLLLGPLLLAKRVLDDPEIFAGNGSSVTFQWVVTIVFSVGALAVLVSMVRSRLAVGWNRITRARGLRRAVTVTRQGCRRVSITQSANEARFDDRRLPPTITVYRPDGRAVVSAQNETEADVLLPVLLDWVLETPALIQEQETARFFTTYERFIAGEIVKHPYR